MAHAKRKISLSFPAINDDLKSLLQQANNTPQQHWLTICELKDFFEGCSILEQNMAVGVIIPSHRARPLQYREIYLLRISSRDFFFNCAPDGKKIFDKKVASPELFSFFWHCQPPRHYYLQLVSTGVICAIVSTPRCCRQSHKAQN